MIAAGMEFLYNKFGGVRPSPISRKPGFQGQPFDVLGRPTTGLVEYRIENSWKQREQQKIYKRFNDNFRGNPLTREMRNFHRTLENLPDLRIDNIKIERYHFGKHDYYMDYNKHCLSVPSQLLRGF
jgi:hypothetical protein